MSLVIFPIFMFFSFVVIVSELLKTELPEHLTQANTAFI